MATQRIHVRKARGRKWTQACLAQISWALLGGPGHPRDSPEYPGLPADPHLTERSLHRGACVCASFSCLWIVLHSVVDFSPLGRACKTLVLLFSSLRSKACFSDSCLRCDAKEVCHSNGAFLAHWMCMRTSCAIQVLRGRKANYYPNINCCNTNSERVWLLYLNLQFWRIDSKSGHPEILDKPLQFLEYFERSLCCNCNCNIAQRKQINKGAGCNRCCCFGN